MRNSIVGPIVVILFFGCGPDIKSDRLVYFNDFDIKDASGIMATRYNFHEFNGSFVMGHFNNDSITIQVDNLPTHNYIFLGFDLYIHDTWDGNKEGVDGPDLWGFSIKTKPFSIFTKQLEYRLETTFSNNECIEAYCGFNFQAYPNPFPFNGTPRSESIYYTTGFCALREDSIGSTVYRFEELFPDRSDNISISMYDLLKQDNVIYPYCDESWSIDNVEIRALEID